MLLSTALIRYWLWKPVVHSDIEPPSPQVPAGQWLEQYLVVSRQKSNETAIDISDAVEAAPLPCMSNSDPVLQIVCAVSN